MNENNNNNNNNKYCHVDLASKNDINCTSVITYYKNNIDKIEKAFLNDCWNYNGWLNKLFIDMKKQSKQDYLN